MSRSAPQPDLPSHVKWPQITRDWWAAWGRSEYATQLTETDWMELLEAALLHARFWSGEAKVAGELRVREERLRRRHSRPLPPPGLVRVDGEGDGEPPTFV